MVLFLLDKNALFDGNVYLRQCAEHVFFIPDIFLLTKVEIEHTIKMNI